MCFLYVDLPAFNLTLLSLGCHHRKVTVTAGECDNCLPMVYLFLLNLPFSDHVS